MSLAIYKHVLTLTGAEKPPSEKQLAMAAEKLTALEQARTQREHMSSSTHRTGGMPAESPREYS